MKKCTIYLLTATLILSCIITGSVFAAANIDDENSVYSWGPWKKMAAPAAGTGHSNPSGNMSIGEDKENHHEKKYVPDSLSKEKE